MRGTKETSPNPPDFMRDAIRRARLAFEIAGRGRVVSILGSEPRFTTVNELTGRLGEIPEAKMLLTAISEAVETYRPDDEAVLVLETEHAIQVLIFGPDGLQEVVGGIDFMSEEDLASFKRRP